MIEIILSLVVLLVLGFIFSMILKKFPKLVFIIAIVIGLVTWYASERWWLGIIIGLFSLGILAWIESWGGDQCAHCNSYDTFRKDANQEIWQCNKCGGITYRK
jgi:hypothetical protein